VEPISVDRPSRHPILAGLLFLVVLLGIFLLYSRSSKEAAEVQLVDVELVSG
jgi:hypothetical protein